MRGVNADRVSLDTITERDWQRTVVEYAHLRRWRTYHTHDSRRSDPGFPDLVLVRDRIVLAELKSERGRMTKDQWAWHDQLLTAGVEVHLWRPSDWEQVREVLQ